MLLSGRRAAHVAEKVHSAVVYTWENEMALSPFIHSTVCGRQGPLAAGWWGWGLSAASLEEQFFRLCHEAGR